MAASAAQPLRERIAFTKDRPIEITLDDDGRPTEATARDGSTEYRYFLAGHKIAYLPEQAHEAIQRARAGNDATFAITKHTTQPWSVVHLEDEPTHVPTPVSQPRSAQPHDAPHQERTAQGWMQRGQPPTPAAPHRPDLPTPAQMAPGPLPTHASGYYTALCGAIQTAAAAERYAEQIGKPIHFTSEDVRCIAAAIFIQEGKR